MAKAFHFEASPYYSVVYLCVMSWRKRSFAKDAIFLTLSPSPYLFTQFFHIFSLTNQSISDSIIISTQMDIESTEERSKIQYPFHQHTQKLVLRLSISWVFYVRKKSQSIAQRMVSTHLTNETRLRNFVTFSFLLLIFFFFVFLCLNILYFILYVLTVWVSHLIYGRCIWYLDFVLD